MSRVDIKRVDKIRNGYAICPHCDVSQDEHIDAYSSPGTYKCDYCYDLFVVDQEAIDSRNEYQSIDDDKQEIEDLKTRVKRLERELGIK